MHKALKAALVVPFLLMALFLGGCFSAGRPIPPQAVKKIVVGQTTRDEVVAAFGNPFRTGLSDNHVTWTYVDYDVSLFGTPKASDLTIKFDGQNKVLSYDYSSTGSEGGM